MKMPISVGFVGLSHLGLVTSSVLSSFKIKTVCFDFNSELIKELQSKTLGINEPGLDELLKQNGTWQQFTSDINDLNQCSLVYISVDIPTNDFGESDSELVSRYILELTSKLNSSITLVLLSQVSPGFTREAFKGVKNVFYYQVETLVFGEAISRSKFPERLIIGSVEPEKEIEENFRFVLSLYEAPIIKMSLESAELTKISINLFLASDVTLTNSISELCEKLGANWSDITTALKLDRRIGNFRYLKPGLGLAGGNIERDLATFSSLATEFGSHFEIVKSILNNSSYRKLWAFNTLVEFFGENLENINVGVWGLTYKENTNSLKNSASIATIKSLSSKQKIYLHDPIISFGEFTRDNIIWCDPPEKMLKQVDVLLILTPWSDYYKFSNAEQLNTLRNKVLIDPYSVIDDKVCADLNILKIELGQRVKGFKYYKKGQK
jgi:UDPglucose 6-dehydrogenase